MPKGYWIAHVDVTDPEGYKEYVAANGVAFAKYGARFLVRAGQACRRQGRGAIAPCGDRVSGTTRPRSPVSILRSIATRPNCATPASLIDLVIVEGYDGPQPG